MQMSGRSRLQTKQLALAPEPRPRSDTPRLAASPTRLLANPLTTKEEEEEEERNNNSSYGTKEEERPGGTRRDRGDQEGLGGTRRD